MMFLLDKIEKYPRKTLEQSLSEVMKSKNKMIGGIYSPIIFNMKYEEIKYSSIDGITLYGWLIKSENATKTLIFCHGRNNNRIFCLRFLQLFLDMNLSESYNIFIPDFRNSGKSDIAKTGFGYFFARDIYSTIKMLKSEFSYNNFILYGFSQGAMGCSAVPYLYKEELKNENIKIEKLILDSPVANIKKLILKNAKIKGIPIPRLITYLSLKIFNKHIDYRLDDMKLSTLLGIVSTLIIQSEKDNLTPYDIVKDEFEKFNIRKEKDQTLASVQFKAFRKGQHVRTYLEYKQEYTQTINKFLESEKL
ncbi:alpha/beta hydrolase [Caviibacter abscessus]|uniref:alpha/beta hydrolase n=1 Tax=Caviibacter abscessus TaxID=1766719 RepID=UPI0008313EC7|nr:alpha/beta fold hydrolase [Caviibacter abscessus]